MLLDLWRPARKPAPAAGDGTPRAPRSRATPGERLVRAVMAMAGPQAELVRHAESPWASVTFTGSRQTLAIRFYGWEGCDDADRLMQALPEHEFRLPGVLVADAGVVGCEQVLLPAPRTEVELELLLLDA